MFTGDFIRPEVWHALSVHFPIALLPVATITLLISFFLSENKRPGWQQASMYLLLAGCVMAWIAIYTGGIADGIVARKICDPTLLKDHEIAGKAMTWLFTAGAALLFISLTATLHSLLRKVGIYLAFILMLTGTGYLVYAGHIGAGLVYEQGAGVKNHHVNCDDYQ
jgi:uncharacterized membrane protein